MARSMVDGSSVCLPALERESLMLSLELEKDVAALCAYANWEVGQYKRFSRPREPRLARPPSFSVQCESKLELPTITSAAPVLVSIAPVPAPATPARSALQLERAHIQVERPNLLSRIALTTCAGGSGVSTITATLARQLTIAGHSVLIEDSSCNRAIPYLFGARPVQQNIVRTLAGAGDGHGDLHLLFSAPGCEAAQRAAAVVMLQGNLDWMVTDCGLGSVPEDADLVLIVCAPEPRSVTNAAAFRRSLRDKHGNSNVFFLLNNYDEDAPFHRRMRAQLMAEIGPDLLPFVVSKAQEFSEAFAEGKTVFEFSPAASICGDFTRLASWLAEQFQTSRLGKRMVA